MFKFSDKTYGVLKAIAMIYLPGLGTLYVTLAPVWNLPNAAGVGATILAVDTFLGTVLGISTAKYNQSDRYDGVFLVNKEAGADERPYTFHVDSQPEDMADKKEIVFKVHS